MRQYDDRPAEERVKEKFGSLDELKRKIIIEQIPKLDASNALLIYEILIRL